MDEIKKEIVDAVDPNAKQMTPVEVAERNLASGIIPFRRSLHNFSKKDLIRVLRHVVLGPVDEPIKFTSAKEGRLASLADQLLVCRFIVQRDQMLKDDAKKLALEKQKQAELSAKQGEKDESKTTEISESGISVDVAGKRGQTIETVHQD